MNSMIKHTITFCKPIKQDLEECTFKLSAKVFIDNNNDKLIKKLIKFCQGYTKTVKCYVTQNTLYINITTKSKCSPYDVPDVVKGKRIAEGKAKFILYKTLSIVSDIFIKYYEDKLEQYSITKMKYLTLSSKELDHLKELDSK